MPQVKKNKTITILFAIFITLFVVVAAFGFGFYKLYFTEINDSTMVKIADSLRLPIARVGDNYISYHDFLFIKDTFTRHMSDDEKSKYSSILVSSIMEQLIYQSIIQGLADKWDIKVSDKEVDEFFNEWSKSDNAPKDIDKFLSEKYDWSVSDYKEHVVKPSLLANKVNTKFSEEHKDKGNLVEYIKDYRKSSNVVIFLQTIKPLPPLGNPSISK